MKKRPLSVTIASFVMLAAGVLGFAYHLSELNLRHPLQNDALLIETIRIVAVVCGVYMFRGHNWARWLTMAWLGLHVFVSAYDSISKLAFHIVLMGIFAYLLFHKQATEYFRGPKGGLNSLPT